MRVDFQPQRLIASLLKCTVAGTGSPQSLSMRKLEKARRIVAGARGTDRKDLGDILNRGNGSGSESR